MCSYCKHILLLYCFLPDSFFFLHLSFWLLYTIISQLTWTCQKKKKKTQFQVVNLVFFSAKMAKIEIKDFLCFIAKDQTFRDKIKKLGIHQQSKDTVMTTWKMSKKNRHFTCEFKEYLQLDSVHQDFKLGSFTAIDFFMFNYGLKLSIEDLICTIIIKKGGGQLNGLQRDSRQCQQITPWFNIYFIHIQMFKKHFHSVDSIE